MNRIYELYIQTAAASKVGGPSDVGPRRHQVPIKGGGLFFGHYKFAIHVLILECASVQTTRRNICQRLTALCRKFCNRLTPITTSELTERWPSISAVRPVSLSDYRMIATAMSVLTA